MKGFVVIIFLSAWLASPAQAILPKDLAKLHRQEDSLKVLCNKLVYEKYAAMRFMADSSFIKTLVRTLKIPYSFDYPFDSLQTVSHLYAPDSSFRIFSWQFTRDSSYCRQRGAIQMRTADGSLKLFPLLDMSDFTTEPQDSIRTGKNWIGCIYYSVLRNSFNGKNFYTLLGFDDNNALSTKKWAEVLYFDTLGNPRFGGPFFSIPTGQIKAGGGGKQARFCLEFKKDGHARMNYDKDLDMIVYDHLIPEDGKSEKASSFVPDGDYQGFKWMNGKWVLVDKIFNQKLEDGQAPMPMPLKDANGKNDETKLMQQSEQTRQRLKEQSKIKTPPAPAKPSKKPVEKQQPSKEKEESY